MPDFTFTEKPLRFFSTPKATDIKKKLFKEYRVMSERLSQLEEVPTSQKWSNMIMITTMDREEVLTIFKSEHVEGFLEWLAKFFFLDLSGDTKGFGW